MFPEKYDKCFDEIVKERTNQFLIYIPNYILESVRK